MPQGQTAKNPTRSTHFLLTLNEPERYDKLKEYLHTIEGLTYYVAAREEAPTTGHEHIHIFVQYSSAKRIGVTKLEGAMIVAGQGNAKGGADYVKKEGKIIEEEGRLKMQGGFRGLTVKEAMELKPIDLLEATTYQIGHIQKARLLAANIQAQAERKYKPIKFIWAYGPTGVGKTRFAFERGAVPVIYSNGFYSDWGDAKIIVIEEFRGKIPYGELLQLSDKYRGYYSVNVKGGQKVVNIKELIITSPYRPEMCYPRQCQKEDSIEQLMRRITLLVHLTPTGVEEEDTKEIRIPEVPQEGRLDLNEAAYMPYARDPID